MMRSMPFVPLLVALAALAAAPARAWEPDAATVAAAVESRDFAGLARELDGWLAAKTPAAAEITVERMRPLLDDPAFRRAVDQRQFIARHGAEPLAEFARDDDRRRFLAWVLGDAGLMDLYLEAAAPSRDALREKNEYPLDVAALERWHTLVAGCPAARAGVLLRLGIASALWGGGKTYPGNQPVDWLVRFNHFKDAHAAGELLPSFDGLTVSEYGKVINCWGSEADMAWGRRMVRTWRPDLLEKDQLPAIVSDVWRRFSPIPFVDFQHVLAGGGKCGPRAFFGAFICQAHGIPAIGVGQPGHACFGVKAAYPETEPQPGSAWKVHQGRGWEVSDCGDAMYGPEFLAEMEKRSRTADFSLVEHLRWLAPALAPPERAEAARAAAREVWRTMAERPLPPAAPPARRPPRPEPAPPPPAPGVIRVAADAFTDVQHVAVHDSVDGGRQLFFAKNGDSWGDEGRATFTVDVPAAGTYALSARTAAINQEQTLLVAVGAGQPVSLTVPWSRGLWEATPPVEIALERGPQTLTLSRPRPSRGVAVKWLELEPRGKGNAP